jgi:hypothetical protein
MGHVPGFVVFGVCIGCSFIFVKGLLCCAYDGCAWILKVLDANVENE